MDLSVPVFSFVGRITEQKGVHLILDAMESLMQQHRDIMILLGGMATKGDKYGLCTHSLLSLLPLLMHHVCHISGEKCSWHMNALRRSYGDRFWCDPEHFFTDGALVNLGSDFALMPSAYEPSGVVQQEYFAAGTPVIAFSTGGLKDTVHEYQAQTGTGNGFVFLGYQHNDFCYAVARAVEVQ